MPFEQYKVRHSEIKQALEPKAIFGDRNIFGHRVTTGNPDGKKAVASYIASRFTKEGASVFASDGSSTFFVCLAMAQSSFEFQREFDLLTNNLGIATELEAQPYSPPPKVKIQIVGGEFDYILNATFPPSRDSATKDQIQGAKLTIVSVRQLFLDEGPTSPEKRSCLIKEYAFQTDGDLVIPLDWTKLAAKEPDKGTLVFNNRRTWKEILQNEDRQITIVSDKPLDKPETDHPVEIGERLEHGVVSRNSQRRWNDATDYERYCWHAYHFSLHRHITFIEMQCDYECD